MYKNKQAFTLIELLVVVLIIGILAAVAVPQYQWAVAKARLANLITMAEATRQAEEAYYLSNGKYTEQWSDLNVDFPGKEINSKTRAASEGGWTLRLTITSPNIGSANTVIASHTLLPGLALYFFYNFNNETWNGNGKRRCYALKGNNLANKLCHYVTGANAVGTAGTGENAQYVYEFK